VVHEADRLAGHDLDRQLGQCPQLQPRLLPRDTHVRCQLQPILAHRFDRQARCAIPRLRRCLFAQLQQLGRRLPRDIEFTVAASGLLQRARGDLALHPERRVRERHHSGTPRPRQITKRLGWPRRAQRDCRRDVQRHAHRRSRRQQRDPRHPDQGHNPRQEAQPFTDTITKPQPVAETILQPEPVPVQQSEAVAVVQPERLAVGQPEPVAETIVQPEPVAETIVQPEPVAETIVQPEPVADCGADLWAHAGPFTGPAVGRHTDQSAGRGQPSGGRHHETRLRENPARKGLRVQ